jgi:GDP-fucose protein O-fucosyltransferase
LIAQQTFEFDGAAWNNKRMSMETTLVLAVAMGRTLVLPPAIGLERMNTQTVGEYQQKAHFTFGDLYPLAEMSAEHAHIDIITMQEYLETEAIQAGSLVHKDRPNDGPFYPPGNRTDWNECSEDEYYSLMEYLKNVTHVPFWNPDECIAAFPASGNVSDLQHVADLLNETFHEGPGNNTFPLPVNGSLHDRIHEMIAGRQKLCIYDEQMEQRHAIHFICDWKTGNRLLAHYYAFAFMDDWRIDLWMKRFMRDHGKPIPLASSLVLA